jgi:alpha-beta hydrolase superfamily lysophospholipase
VELITSDDVRLQARRWSTESSPRATVVLVHGFSSNRSEARVVGLADALHGAGFAVLTYDARGHGESGGEATLGDEENRDVAAAVAAVAGDRTPVVVVGASMGAIAALRYVASGPDSVAGVVAVSCPARWRLPLNARGLASALLTRTPLGRRVARDRIGVRIAPGAARAAPPVELVGALGVPLALVHGRRDPFLAVDNAERLYAAAAEPRRLVLVDELGHAFEAESVEPILAAVAWCLDRAPSGDPTRREVDVS